MLFIYYCLSLLMWNSPLYTVNVFYSHWLVKKKPALAYSRAKYYKAENASRDRGGRKLNSGRCHVAAKG